MLTAAFLSGLMVYVGRGTDLVRIESDARRAHHLARAKQALLGYAASYAEQHSGTVGPEIGPGYLPCPDIDGDGSPDPACPRNAAGDLPWRRLGLPPEVPRIRYVLSPAYRSNPAKHVPLNTETRGELVHGARGGIVAVLTSAEPGETRDSGGAPVPGAGKDATSLPEGGDAGVRTLVLSDHEIGRAMEARALVAAARALEGFRAAGWNAAGTYPWLNTDLLSPAYRATVGGYRGSLAVHGPGVFATGFTFGWWQPEAHRAHPDEGGAGHPVSIRVRVEEPEGRCVWEGASIFHCEGTGLVDGSPVPSAAAPETARVRLRVVAGHLSIRAPDAMSVRARGARFAGVLTAGTWVEVSLRSGEPEPPRRVYRAQPGDAVRVEIEGVRYALAVPEEIPGWFVTHGWHRLIHVVLSAGHAPGGGGRCDDPWACLRVHTVTGERPAGGVIIGTGAALAHQRRDDAATLDDYLEGPNAEPDARRFVAGPVSRRFNDRVRRLPGVPAISGVGSGP